MKKIAGALVLVLVLVGFSACTKGDFTVTVPPEYTYIERQGEKYYYYGDEDLDISRYLEVEYEKLDRLDQKSTMELMEEADVDELREWMFEGDDPETLDLGFRKYGDYDGWYISFTDYEDDVALHVHIIYVLIEDHDLWVYGDTIDETPAGMIADMESIVLSARFE